MHKVYRILLLTSSSPLARDFVSELLEHPRYILRVGCSWAESADPILSSADEVAVIEPDDPRSLRIAARACNAIIWLSEPTAGADAIARMRALAEICRQTEATRILVNSCASMLAPSQGPLADHLGAYLPGAGTSTMDARYALEQEVLRLAADALDVILIEPGLCLGSTLPELQGRGRLADDSLVSVVSTRALVRAHVAALESGVAGMRYPVAQVNAWGAELRAALAGAPARLPRSRAPRFQDPLVANQHLDTFAARLHLGLEPLAGLDEVLRDAW